MTRFLPDTSVMVAAVCSWHEHHERVARDLERRLGQKGALILAAPAMVETYAVLTRLPPPHRLSPADALALLEANFLAGSKLIALDASTYRTLLKEASRETISGGRTYDWVIATCAIKAKVSVLLTLNAKDFLPFSGAHLQIVVPGESAS